METDEQLMVRYCDGDGSAFDALYRRHRGAVFRYVKRLAAAGMDAEALFHDAWIRVIQGRARWQRGQPFLPWLYRIAHNRVVDELRRQGRFENDADDAAAVLASPDPEPVLAQWWRDCVERLRRLLGTLPEVQRSAFLLREEAGLSLEQIAQVTGTGRETVKSRLRYAVQRLRAGLEGCDD